MDELLHYGTPRHSGRYPWGSGKNPQRNKNFLSYVNEYTKLGLSQAEIAKALIGPEATSTQLRAKISIATNEIKKENRDRARRLRNEKGYGPTEIGRIMNQPESTIRTWLKGDEEQHKNKVQVTADTLKKNVDEKGYIDVGKGVELSLGTTATNLNVAIEALKEQGYTVHNVQVQQQGTQEGMKTTIKVLAPPGTTYKDVNMHKEKITTIEDYSKDGAKGISRLGLPPVQSVDSDRIMVRYEEDGGRDKDGVIELRRGVEDLSLGNAKYAQVRIAVDGKVFMKGMAIYADDKDMPPGVDIIYNSNKSKKEYSKLEVMKPLKTNKDGTLNEENPFGASIMLEEQLKRVPRKYIDKNGKEQISPINVVNEEGNWEDWSKKLASQMLSKQPYQLVKKQLELSYDIKKAEFDEICAVTNPVVKKKLLEGFASDCDSQAVHLEAASLPRQATHVILPLPDIKENEIFAPRYHTGEQVALVRYPHGGTFEIPILTVNNNVKSGKKLIGTDSPDAVGIHPSAAVKLSGADFDGDTALVIPTGGKIKIKSRDLLPGLKGFDEQKEALYKMNPDDPGYYEVKKGSRTEQTLMGKTTNLITDMTLLGANDDDLARAVRHSMVVIDTAKHHLDYKKSERDNGIAELKKRYQVQEDGGYGGVSTIISRAKSPIRVKLREPDKEGTGNSMGWDPETGEVKWVEKKGQTYPERKKNKDGTYTYTGKFKNRETETTRMAETNDAMTLVSTFRMPTEIAYANYANGLKGLANEARKEYLGTKAPRANPEATKAYSKEVASLNSKLNIALKNSPRERQAQLYADHTIELAKQAVYPDTLDKDEMKKKRAQALAAGRAKFNAKKEPVKFSEKEWEAVQAGAISPSKLKSLLENADLDKVKKLATPKQARGLRPAQITSAKNMLAMGYTLEEVADKFGVSSSTISNAMK